MKKSFVFWLLVICLSFSCLAACDPGDSDESETTGVESAIEGESESESENESDADTESGTDEAVDTETESETTESSPYSVGLEFRSNSDGTCSVIGLGSCTDTDIIIPPTSPVGDVVVAIGDGAFIEDDINAPVIAGGSDITSVIIPDSVTSIGRMAFFSCVYLTDVTIGNGVESIGEHAFYACAALESITISDSVTSIGYEAFRDCRSMASIEVEENNPVYHSAGNCLIETESKTLVVGCNASVIPTDGSVTSIGDSAFVGSGLESVTIPDNVTRIGGWAFRYCESLATITISDSVMSIGGAAFCDTSYYDDENNWEDGVLYIGSHLIKAKETLYTSPSYVVKAGTKTIADHAFTHSDILADITIPDSVRYIGAEAFNFCVNLASITFEGTTDEWNTIEKGEFWNFAVSATEVVCSNDTVSLQSDS